jgi:phosphoglycerate dehydrogenase-like enzyme
MLEDKEIWVTGTCPPYFIDKWLIDISPQLKILATPSTGTNHFDFKYAISKKITVLSLKDAPVIEDIHASAEFSFSLLLAMVNKIPYSYEQARMGVWREKEHEFRSTELSGKTLGLVGYGRIGRKMAKFAKSFNMSILAYDPYKKIEEPYVRQIAQLDELLNQSDKVSIHVHLNDETRQMVDSEFFRKMKDNSYFLNTARGEIVDEYALIESLKSGKLRAAAVDVISDEHIPNKWSHPVIEYARNNHNLIVTPHIAGCTVDSEFKAAKYIIEQIEKCLSNAKAELLSLLWILTNHLYDLML